MTINLAAILRSSEFWVAVGQAVIEVTATPVPPQYAGEHWVAWGYVGVRIASKVVKFVFPNPTPGVGVKPGWFKAD